MSRSAYSGTLYADQAQLEEWFSGAQAGAQVVYARGHVLDPKHPVPVLVRDWIATGEARPKQKRNAEGGGFIYWVERCRPGSRAAADQSGRERVSADAEWRETADGKIYMTLVRAANLGLPCPSNATLAQVAGLRDADAARYRVRVLSEEGRIQVTLSGAGRSFRRVRIIETGRWTADEPGSAPLPGLELKGNAA